MRRLFISAGMVVAQADQGRQVQVDRDRAAAASIQVLLAALLSAASAVVVALELRHRGVSGRLVPRLIPVRRMRTLRIMEQGVRAAVVFSPQ
jgi:hypothetical protein